MSLWLQRRNHQLVACAILLVAAVGLLELTGSRSEAAGMPAGIAELRFTAHGSAGDSPVTAIGLSLLDSRYRVRPMLTNGKRLSQLRAVAAIDGDFYNLHTGQPSGRLVINGSRLSGSDTEPSIVLDPRATRITRYPLALDANVISGKPRLIIDGEAVRSFTADGATQAQDRTVAPRSAVALKGNQLWLVACGEPGLRMVGWAKLLQSRGFDEALNLDGGPSTGLIAGGHVVVGQDAEVPTALAIVRR